MIRTITLSLLAAACTAAMAQEQNDLLGQTLKAGGFAESITAFCTQKNARGAQQYQAALREWKQRNHWEAISAKAAPGQADEAAATAVQAIRRQGNKAVILCLDLRKTLATSTFDPSQQHAQELAQLADGEVPQGQMKSPTAPPQQQEAPVSQAPRQSGTSAAVTPVANGSAVQVGDASFSAPATWRPGKATATEAIFQRPAKDRGEMQIFAFQQKPLQGDFKATFAAMIRGMVPGKPPELKNIYPSKTRTGIPALQVRDGSRLQTGKSAALRAVGVQLPGNQIFVALLLSTDRYGGLRDAERELGAVISSLQFRSQPTGRPWDALADHGNGNATGVYWYSTITNMPNAFGGMDTRAERKYVVLLPGGRAYRELPEGGRVLDMDFEATCHDPKKMDNCGSYDLQGSAIRFRWPDDFGLMTESTGSYVAGKSLKSEDMEYYYVAPVNGGLRLNGKYTSFFASVGQTAFSSGAVSSEKSITFLPEGRYQSQSFSGASFSNTGAQGTTSSKKAPVQGTYEIDGYTLRLKPDNGPEQRYTVILEEQGAHPKAVFIDDDGYLPK